MPRKRLLLPLLPLLLLLAAHPAGAQLAVAPGDVVFRASGGLFRLEPESGRVSALAGVALDGFVTAMAFEASGDLVVGGQTDLRRIDAATGAITPLAAYDASWDHEVLPLPDGRLYTVAYWGSFVNAEVREIDVAGGVRLLGSVDRCALETASCGGLGLTGAALDADGTLLVLVEDYDAPGGIVRFDPATDETTQAYAFAATHRPRALARDDDGTWLVFVGTPRGSQVWRVDLAAGTETLVAHLEHGLGGLEVERRGDGQLVVQRQEGYLLLDPQTGVERFFRAPQGAMAVVPGVPAPPACANGADDDGDRRSDFPRDAGCSSPFDGSELPPCADGLDNDGDGLVDFPADPGCAGTKTSHQEAPACDDAIDNDGDGWFDHPDDPECLSPHHDNEAWAPLKALRRIFGAR